MHEAFETLAKLVEANSPIDVDGTPFTIRLIDIREDTPPGSAVIVVVGAKSVDESHTGELHLGRDRLNDLDYIAEASIATMNAIVNGDLPPGARGLP